MEIGHNSLTEEVFLQHLASISRAEADLAEARAIKNKARKKAKASGINLGELDAMRRVAELTRAEQIESINTQAQYLKWLRVPIGSQLEMFKGQGGDDPFDPAATAEKDATAEAEKQGFMDGISGKAEENPFDGAGTIGRSWLKGYRDGRARFDAVPDPMDDDDGDGEEH